MMAPEPGRSPQAMNDIVAFLVSTGPPVVVIAVAVVLLRVLAPVDLTALLYPPREPAWPRGVQEEDPRPWDFTARPAQPSPDPADTGEGVGPPPTPTAVHPSTRPRSARPR
jgi:hypothetical protein